MGLPRRTVAYRTDEQTRLHHECIRTALPWLLEDHTSVIKFCARIVYALLFTSVTVQDVRDLLQGLHRMTLQGELETTQYELPFAPVGMALRVRIGRPI
jgi:hypothetical protein